MLTKEERQKELVPHNHTIAYFYERGIKKRLFPHCEKTAEVWREFVEAFRDEKRSVITRDERKSENINSSHICMFINENGNPVAVPILMDGSKIHVFTLKDIKEDWLNPNWFVRKYNEVAEERGMPLMSFIVK